MRVWTAKRVNEARLEDRHGKNGDFGKLGVSGLYFFALYIVFLLYVEC